ncbi:MAG: FlgD immunoglobulin-like domain containing protein [Ignavibacteriaceae bacterium]
MKYFSYLNTIFILLSITVNAQTYNGPATGSVNSGVVVTTDDFLFIPEVNKSSEPPRVYKMMEYEPEPIKYDGNTPVFDNYVYVDDSNTNSSLSNGIGTSFELHSFESIPFVNGWPPDPAMSVGPNHVIAAVNGRFNIYDRDGNQLISISESAWVNQVVNAPLISDPQVIYDHYNGRFVMLWFTRNNTILEAPFVICYSDDENPIGTWYMYAIGSELNGDTSAVNWGDYPKIGYDYQALYINSRQFAFAGGYDYDKIRILNSSEFYAAQGDSISWTDIWNIRINGSPVDVIHPCYSYDAGIDTAYFVYARDGNGPTNTYTLFRISEPLSNPVLSSVNLPIPVYYRAPSARQLGGSNTVDVFTWIAKAPVLRDGKIYAAHSIRNSHFIANASLKYFVIDVNSNAVIEQVEQGAQGYYYITPAITVDKDHNIAITYSRSADAEYIGAYYSTRLATDPPGLSQSKVMMQGQRYFGANNRWGDYFSAAVDPINQYNIWLYSQFRSATADWSTWLTEIRMKPYADATLYTRLNPVEFNDTEVGTNPTTEVLIISNYGEKDLIINDITSQVGPFTLLTDLSFPLTLSTYDSLDLELEFNPDSVALYNLLMSFDDNDPNFDGLTLNGTGFEINPAVTGSLYSSTGIQGNGRILTVDKNTGSGTELGSSNFNELNSLAINPNTNIIYGISTGTSATELARVNATGGDAYTEYELDLGLMSSVAFDTSGTLYGSTRAGDIYTIDLSDGSYQNIVSASIEITSITFHPVTNELWASPRIVFGPTKDKIFTIDLTTGDAKLVGETGFDVTTNDLAFDDDGTLYGIIGGAMETGELITISTTDAAGTLVGQIGFDNVTGLAYSLSGEISSIGNETDEEEVPKEYDLSQNYPNPFNPSTSIEFSVPVNSNVTLTIYNLLGQAITTLVNEEMNAGTYNVVWNGEDQNGIKVSSGIYLYKMRAKGTTGEEFQHTRKMVLLK